MLIQRECYQLPNHDAVELTNSLATLCKRSSTRTFLRVNGLIQKPDLFTLMQIVSNAPVHIERTIDVECNEDVANIVMTIICVYLDMLCTVQVRNFLYACFLLQL